MKVLPKHLLNREWFLVLLPLFFTTHGFVRYPEAVSLAEHFSLFLKYIALLTVALVPAALLLGFRNATLFSIVVLLFYCTFGSFFDYLRTLPFVGTTVRYSFVVPLLLSLLLGLFFYFKKSKRSFNRLSLYLNLLSLFLIALDLLPYYYHKTHPTTLHAAAGKEAPHQPQPDIYLIVTDGYAGATQLQARFSFNNHAFLDSLKKIGFHVVDSTQSNYSATFSSMATLLSLQYKQVDPEKDVHAVFNKMHAAQFLRAHGYTVINNSIFKLEEQFPVQPISYFPIGKKLITQHHFGNRLKSAINTYLVSRGDKKTINKIEQQKNQMEMAEKNRDLFTYRRLCSIVTTPSSAPKFVYTHFIMPHPPYLFAANGAAADTRKTVEEQYILYLQYTNGWLLKTLSFVLQHSKRPPLIILISDHGYRNDASTNVDPLRFFNLAAVYRWDKNYGPYYKGMSNVNQFRILFNQQFNQRLSLLPDSTVH